MTDKVEETVVVTTKEEVKEVPQPTETEIKASEQGWMPKEKWEEEGRNPDEWRPAKEFVDRGELFKTIHSTKRELKQTQAALDALKRHHQYVFDKAHQKALEDLKQEKRKAIRDEDLERVEVLDEQIEQEKVKHAEAKAVLTAQPVSADVPPEFAVWQAQNTWYETDSELRDEADAIGMVYIRRNQGAKPADVLSHIDSKMKSRYPEKFGVRKAAHNPTLTNDKTQTRQRGREETLVLDEMETQIMESLVSSGEMTKAQYISELKKAKGIK